MDHEPTKKLSADQLIEAADRPLDEEREDVASELRNLSSKTATFDGQLKGIRQKKVGEDRPTKVGRYVIQDKLGSGNVSDVYRAEDVKLGRMVAIKITKSQDEQSDDKRDNYLHEARAAANLQHPGIVAIYDADQDGPYTYIVQELVEGSNLRTYLNQNELTAKQAAAMLILIAEAVAFAHKKGFVHRDLKPANILLDQDGRPRVADFGLALHEEQQHQHKNQITGTPFYMSPEQLRGDVHLLDGRSDIWSLGVILYEMIAGQRPFRSKEPRILIEQILDRDPKPLRQINESIPAAYEPIVRKCLAKEMTDRYSSANDLARDLKRAIAPSRRLGPWMAVAALLVLALGVAGWQLGITSLLTSATAVEEPGSLVIDSFFVTHFRDLTDRSEHVGSLGSKSFACQENDSVRVDAQFNQPAYCYLIAFNPDGSQQLCFPEDPRDSPAPIRSLTYPSDATSAFFLTDGEGEQAFVLVALAEPLSSYTEWRKRLDGVPWPLETAGHVFRFDGRQVSLMQDRGTIGKMKGMEQIEEFCQYLSAKSEGATIQVWGFPVFSN